MRRRICRRSLCGAWVMSIAVESNRPGIGLDQPDDHPRQCRFPATALADDPDRFAGSHPNGRILDRVDRRRSAPRAALLREALAQAGGVEEDGRLFAH